MAARNEERSGRESAETRASAQGPGRRSTGARGARGPGLWSITRPVALAAAQAILADRDASGRLTPPEPERCRQVVDEFALTIGHCSGTMRLGMNGLLALIELLPAVVVRRWRRMSRLTLADRIAYLQALEEGERGLLTMLLVGIKVPMSIYAFERGEGLRQTGFDRPSTASPTRARRPSGGGRP
jgi:hypothetical protein